GRQDRPLLFAVFWAPCEFQADTDLPLAGQRGSTTLSKLSHLLPIDRLKHFYTCIARWSAAARTRVSSQSPPAFPHAGSRTEKRPARAPSSKTPRNRYSPHCSGAPARSRRLHVPLPP